MPDQITVTLKCLVCSADPITLITTDATLTGDSFVRCKGCGHEFGRYLDMKSEARRLAAEFRDGGTWLGAYPSSFRNW